MWTYKTREIDEIPWQIRCFAGRTLAGYARQLGLEGFGSIFPQKYENGLTSGNSDIYNNWSYTSLILRQAANVLVETSGTDLNVSYHQSGEYAMESQPKCQCPKWYEVVSAQELLVLLQKYLVHPEYGKDFTIQQPCFMCKNDDRTETFSIDEFNVKELFGKLPHPETLNFYFVGCFDGTDSVMRGIGLGDTQR